MPPQVQGWIPEQYQANAGFVPELGRAVVDLLAPRRGERILDLGCGDGKLTLEIARDGSDVTGVDASQEMVDAARKLGIQAHCVDGAALHFSQEFDAVFSNAALHWIKPPENVAEGVWRALRPGGRFVGEFGGHGNVAHIVRALRSASQGCAEPFESPWYFPTSQEYARLLTSVGFQIRSIEIFPRPTRLPGDVRGWLETFASAWLDRLPAQQRAGILSRVVDDLRPHLMDADGHWHADYVRLRFWAERPAR